jgi:hypothetical protein
MEDLKFPKKKLLLLVGSLLALIVLSIVNPFAWNDGGERTVIQRMSGNQFVEFKSGVYYAGFFAKTTVWPNQITVSYLDTIPNLELVDNSIEIGNIEVRFGQGDASTAKVKGIVQYILPVDEKDMITVHNTHRTPESLVIKRLASYTKECLQSSAQLLSSEMHYSGGRTQMAQDFIDQLRYGSYILKTTEDVKYDSIEKENKRIYRSEIKNDKSGKILRKGSSIDEYNITVADAQITDVDYEPLVDKMLAKKITASTAMSVAKQDLMTAQQKKMTAAAQGEQALVEIEYQQKQEQTKQIVTAETRKEVAKLEKEAAVLESEKIKVLAEAESYKNSRLVSAGLTPQEKAEWDYKTKVGVAEKMSQVKLPNTVIQGNTSGGSGQASMLESLLGVKLLDKQ